MKPGYLRNRTESENVGRAVAKLVTDKGEAKNVLLSSFDPFKIVAAKQQNPSLVVGTFYKKGMWGQIYADTMKSEFGDLPGMRQCVEKAPNGTELMDFLFQTGDLLKSTNSSFVVMDYNIFNNPQYSNNTFQTFAENYSPDVSFGAFIIDNLALTDEQRKNDEKTLELLIAKSASALVTDDVPRLLMKLDRAPASTDQPTAKASANKAIPTALSLFPLFLLGWFVR